MGDFKSSDILLIFVTGVCWFPWARELAHECPWCKSQFCPWAQIQPVQFVPYSLSLEVPDLESTFE